MNSNNPLLTDLYQLTMAAGYFHAGKAEREAVFRLGREGLGLEMQVGEQLDPHQRRPCRLKPCRGTA